MRPLDRTERYGLVSVVFLVTTIAAVTLWDTETKTGPEKEELRSDSDAALAAAPESGGRASGALGVDRQDPGRAGPALTLPRPGGPARTLPAGDGGRAAAGSSGLLAPPVGSSAPRSAGSAVLQGDAALQGNAVLRGDAALRAEPPASSEREAPSSAETASTASAPPPAGAGAEPPRTGGRVNGGSALVRPVPGVRLTVELKPGETLSQVAQRELGSSRQWKAIAALNGIEDPTAVRAGTVLRLPPREIAAGAVPKPDATTGARPAASSNALPAGTVAYEVRDGESYWKLAQRFLGKGSRWEELLALNPSVPPAALRAGRTIAIPASAAASSAAAAPPRGVEPALVADGPSRKERKAVVH